MDNCEHIDARTYAKQGADGWMYDRDGYCPFTRTRLESVLRLAFEAGARSVTPSLPQYAEVKAHAVRSRLEKSYPHKGMIRGFHHTGNAWYSSSSLPNGDIVDEVSVGFYGESGVGGTTGEFGVRWQLLNRKVTPCLRFYDDAWDALAHFSDVLAEMALLNNEDVTPEDFCEMLKRLGVADLTKRERS